MDNKSKKLSPEQLKDIEGFKLWLKKNNYSPKDEKEVTQLYKLYKSLQTKKAAHGAKLSYFRFLNNQCPEGQELVYYKKGGSVKCGCKKKEDGGEIEKAQAGWKSKFKNRSKEEQKKIDKLSEEDYFNGTADHKMNPRARREEPEQPKVTRPKPSSTKSAKKDTAKIDHMKCGSKVKKDCGGSVISKFKAARCGSKIKK